MEADLRSLALQEQGASEGKRKIGFPVWAAAAAMILFIPTLMLFKQSASVAVITE